MKKTMNVYFKTIDEKTLPILEKLRQARYGNLRYWLNEQDFKSLPSYPRDLKRIDDDTTDFNLFCYSWDVETMSVATGHTGLAHLVHRALTQSLEFVCIDNCQHPKNKLILFQDAPHLRDYPQDFIKIPCFNTYEALIDHLQDYGFFDFTLEDSNHFTKLPNYNIKGACVYREISTKHFWYKDTLHKTHYEVFDSTGKKHLGEADMNGHLDPKTRDPKKQLIL